jgi:hypothetical protein
MRKLTWLLLIGAVLLALPKWRDGNPNPTCPPPGHVCKPFGG